MTTKKKTKQTAPETVVMRLPFSGETVTVLVRDGQSKDALITTIVNETARMDATRLQSARQAADHRTQLRAELHEDLRKLVERYSPAREAFALFCQKWQLALPASESAALLDLSQKFSFGLAKLDAEIKFHL